MRRIHETLSQLFVASIVFCVKSYQYLVSPLLGQNCRFEPTCSVYAITAVQRHGVSKGILLTIYRVLRCNRLCRGGYDPVPAVKKGQD